MEKLSSITAVEVKTKKKKPQLIKMNENTKP